MLKLLMLSLLVFSVSKVAAVQGEERSSSATYRWWGIKVYDAYLRFTPENSKPAYQVRPLEFKIVYDIDIERDELIETTVDEWNNLAISKTDLCQSRQDWVKLLANIWPNLSQGDQLTLKVAENGSATFLHNQKEIGTLHDQNFAPCFLAIWLAEDTSAKSLRRDLLQLSRRG